MSLDDQQKTFIGYLLNLAKEGQEDRGALADLRSGLGKAPGQMIRVHRHVVPYLPEQRYNDNDRWYYITATLFGSFPKYRKNRSLGAAFQPLRAKSGSMEARFVALLNAHPDDLDNHLRHAVSLLKANEQPLDWFRLLDDLLQWEHPEGYVQLKWAQDFYKSNKSSGGDTSQASTNSEKKEKESHE